MLGIDYGARRVGLALSDPMRIISSPYRTLAVKSTTELLTQLAELVREQEVTEIVVGLPLRADDTESDQTRRVREFIRQLRETLPQIPIHTVDEAYSSHEARARLRQAGKKARRNKGLVDQTAAAVILEQFLREQSGR